MFLVLGLLVILAAIWATVRRVDVRLALLMAAIALGLLAGTQDLVQHLRFGSETDEGILRVFIAKPMEIMRTFLTTFSSEKFVVPLCSAMGFAQVLRLTRCDQHLVHLLVKPLRAVRPLLIPGTVVVGFLVNIPVISQTSTAVCLGAVLVPLLLAARIPPITAGAALLLGCSVGGELLNPGAPEINTVASITKESETAIAALIFPLLLVQLGVAGSTFWMMTLWQGTTVEPEKETDAEPTTPEFRVNYLKAAVPVLPVLLLFLAGPPLYLVEVPRGWLVDVKKEAAFFSSRLVGAAMLLGVVAAVLTTPSSLRDAARAFFEGAGYAFTNIISLIVVATCLGRGVELIGLASEIGQAIVAMPDLLLPAAAALPVAFGFLCGSGMATTQSLYPFFAGPAAEVGISPAQVGAVVSIAAAAGRTMSPVAAVTLMCASMTGTSALELARRVAIPLLLGMAVVVVVAMMIAIRV